MKYFYVIKEMEKEEVRNYFKNTLNIEPRYI
jgi:hypothetical protein